MSLQQRNPFQEAETLTPVCTRGASPSCYPGRSVPVPQNVLYSSTQVPKDHQNGVSALNVPDLLNV